MNEWLEFEDSSNKIRQTYIKGFLDMSGNLMVRDGSFTVTNGPVDINGNTIIRGGLVVDGPLNFGGNVFLTDICNNILISSSVDISNTGIGPSLVVRQFRKRIYRRNSTMIMIL